MPSSVPQKPGKHLQNDGELLDAVNRQLLAILVDDARTSTAEMARRVGMSSPAVRDRLNRLEEAGVIASYVALVAPERVGLGLTAYLNVRLEKQTDNPLRNPRDLFRAAVQTWPEVVECAAMTGEMDYLLRVLVQDMQHYARFISDTLLKHPSVQDCKTSFVLERLKNTTAVPV